MSAPVDLTNLRSMTDGDKDMEQALFEEFISSFETCFANLKQSTADSLQETWRKEAHALKGISLNLGAEKLGHICKKGQDEPTASLDAKNTLIQEIGAEYDLVKRFLQSL